MTVPEPIPSPDRVWTSDEWTVISGGHQPRDMDDKWIAFVEDDRLYLHRSWTGLGVYEAVFTELGNAFRIKLAFVEGNRETYRRRSDSYESALLEAVIESVLLGESRGPACRRWREILRSEGEAQT